MSGLILPGDVPKRGQARLFVPRGYEDRDRVLVGTCHVCGAVFYRGEEETWQRHVGACAREHLSEIMDARAEEKRRAAAFQEENWDPEAREALDRIGERMKREGRLVQLKNERIGG